MVTDDDCAQTRGYCSPVEVAFGAVSHVVQRLSWDCWLDRRRPAGVARGRSRALGCRRHCKRSRRTWNRYAVAAPLDRIGSAAGGRWPGHGCGRRRAGSERRYRITSWPTAGTTPLKNPDATRSLGHFG